MASKRNMPSKFQIYNYWKDLIFDFPDTINTCWGCGFESNIQRCHIHDRCESNNDNLDNLILLCSYCHKLQENMCRNKESRLNFTERLIDGALFMNNKIKFLMNKLEFYSENELLQIQKEYGR